MDDRRAVSVRNDRGRRREAGVRTFGAAAAELTTMPLEELYHNFERYDAMVFNVATCQGQEPTEEHIADFERTIGFRLPDEFRAFTKSPLGGLYIEVKEELWPRPGLYAVGEFWSFLYGL